MSHQPSPAMSPDSLPQQTLYLVETLPDFDALPAVCEAVRGFDNVPKRRPHRAQFIAQTEWSWSPMHSRLDNYHISLDSRRQRWVLWTSHFNDQGTRWYWETCEDVLVMSRAGVDRVTAAQALLWRYWRIQTDENPIDEYHWLGATGLLSVGQIRAVGERVWGA